MSSNDAMGMRSIQRIHGLICDVDGVLTNGQIGCGTGGQEVLFFDVHDGLAMRLACWSGLKVAWLTGRMSDPITRRARMVDVPLYAGIADKATAVRAIARDLGLDLNELAYVGDDLSDLRAFELVGLPVAVANASDEVKRRASYVTQASGGSGAVREVVELILKNTGGWDAAVARYLQVLGEPDLVCSLPRTEE